MIEIKICFTPKTFWFACSNIVRSYNGLSVLDVAHKLKEFCNWVENRYNIDSDYLYTFYALPSLHIYSFHPFIRG